MFASFTCQAVSLQSAFLAHRSLGHEVNTSLTKLVWARLLDIGQTRFLNFY